MGFTEVARGLEPASLVIHNTNVVNVMSGRIVQGLDIAIWGGYIVGVGHGYEGEKNINGTGMLACPGFIDAHMHVESTLMYPGALGDALLPWGTTGVVADCHEIANVLGVEGVRRMLGWAGDTKMDVWNMIPSCVPASDKSDGGGKITNHDIVDLLEHDGIGLGEVMNVPGVLSGDSNVITKITTVEESRMAVDGHAPGLKGKDLCAYIAQGIYSDHECTTREEAMEKIRLGMSILIREGTITRDLDTLASLAKDPYMVQRLMLCHDDILPTEIMAKGHMNDLVNRLTLKGVKIPHAVAMASINVARYYGLKDRGAIIPGYRADILLFNSAMMNLHPAYVIKDGELLYCNGVSLDEGSNKSFNDAEILGCVRMKVNKKLDFHIPVPEDYNGMRIIDVIDGQAVTKEGNTLFAHTCKDEEGALACPEKDMAKIAVVDRYTASPVTAKGFVSGLQFFQGAIASTVCHDHHNIIVAGYNDEDMVRAVRLLEDEGGGLVACLGNEHCVLPLPIAGLMSNLGLGQVALQLQNILHFTRNKLRCLSDNPFMALSFLGLEVIPELKITNQGLIGEGLEKLDLFY